MQATCLVPNSIPKEQLEAGDTKLKYNFITTYNHSYSAITQVLNKHWSLLKNDPCLKTLVPDKPKLTFRRATTIKNTIAPSRLRAKTETVIPTNLGNKKGCFKCLHPRCKCCLNLTQGQQNNTSSYTGITYRIKSQINCSSSFVIYLLTCTYKLQYIGRTAQALRVCINQHRSNCNRGYSKHSVSRHAAIRHTNSFETFTVSVIEQIQENGTDRFGRLQQREMFWIYKFNTITPFGLNEALETVY